MPAQIKIALHCCLLIILNLFSTQVMSDTSYQFVQASEAIFANPHDLKLSPDGKLLFVSDVNNNQVAIIEPDSLALLGKFGADHQAGTHDIDLDQNGLVYVADTHNNRITIYRIDGLDAQLVGTLSEGIRGPEGVLAHPNGMIYVAGAWSGNVVAYRDGKPVNSLHGLSSPHDLELDPEGNIWLADAGNDRMLLLDPELTILRELSAAPYQFNGVRYQDVLPDGTLIVADKNTHSVKIISQSGELLQVIGTGRPGKGPDRFTTPEGVETRGETLWISDSGNDRIVKYMRQ